MADPSLDRHGRGPARPRLVGEEVDEKRGGEIRDAREPFFKELLGEVEPLHGAHELIVDLKGRGLRVVLASSSPEDELEHYLELLDARDLADAWTTKEDVESTKPAPDLVRVALEKAGTESALMIGDTRWDVEAAGRAGVKTVCVMTGGWSEQELRDAGAVAVFDSVDELRRWLEEVGLIPQLAG